MGRYGDVKKATKEKEKNESKGKEVAKRGSTEMSSKSFFNMFGDYSGYEKNANEESQPFLKIAQKLTAEMSKKNSKYLPDLNEGDFFNGKSRKVYGPKIQVIQIGYYPYYTEWNDMSFVRNYTTDQIQEMTARGQVNKIDFSLFHGKNRISDTRAHFLLVKGHLDDGLSILALSSTGIKHSRAWYKLAQTIKDPNDADRVAPSYTCIWELETEITSSKKGDYANIGGDKNTNVKFVGFVKPTPELLEKIKEGMETFKAWVERLEAGKLPKEGEGTKAIDDDSISF